MKFSPTELRTLTALRRPILALSMVSILAACDAAGPLPSVPFSMFLQPPSDMPTRSVGSDARCNIEFLQGQPLDGSTATAALQRTQWILIRGWAAGGESNQVPARAWLRLGSGSQFWLAQLSFNELRPDVAKAIGNGKSANLGFHNVFAVSDIPAGDYRLTVVISEARGMIECAADRKVTLI